MYVPKNNQEGFTLVETLVAITILLLVIVGPMTISTSTARTTSFASEQITAFFLAQEGVEIVQRARDGEVLGAGSFSEGWDNFADTSGTYEDCYEASGCGLSLNTNLEGSIRGPVICSGDDCLLYFHGYESADRRDRYTHESSSLASTTPYTRVIKLEKSGDEVRATSRVTWRSGLLREQQEVMVETYLFNIYD